MSPILSFILGSIAATFVGGLFFAILAARGIYPVRRLASLFAPDRQDPPTAATTGGA